MKQPSLLFAFVSCLFLQASSQVNGSFYTLKLGDKTCLFKYEEEKKHLKGTTANSKDTLIKTLALQNTDNKLIDIKVDYIIDSDPKDRMSNPDETQIRLAAKANYNIETQMSYTDFLLLLKSKFELHNPQKNIRVYSYEIYYQAGDDIGFIKVNYPQTSEGVISKLNILYKNGGFILLSLKGAYHDDINIDAGSKWLALIHIKN